MQERTLSCIAEITGAKILREGATLTYTYYQKVGKGKVPRNAPTCKDVPVKADTMKEKREDRNMQKYVCSVCGYVYGPGKGDSEGGISPGIAFEDLPDDWTCPVCGAVKDEFDPE